MLNNLKKSCLLILAFLSISSPISVFALDVGAQAPDFDLPGVVDNVKLSKLKGKLVYLDFWASWCGPCKQSFPWMNAMQEKYQAQGFEVVAINLDEKNQDAQKFLASTPAKFTVGFDSKGLTPDIFGVKGMPTSLLIGRDGKVVFQHMGFNAAEKDKLEQKIQSLLTSAEDKK